MATHQDPIPAGFQWFNPGPYRAGDLLIDLADHRFEHPLLVLELVVERSTSDSESTDEVLRAGGRVPILGEQKASPIEDGSAGPPCLLDLGQPGGHGGAVTHTDSMDLDTSDAIP